MSIAEDETPLERALRRKDNIEYCDECHNWIVVNGAAYCKASGKLIHPLMYERGQGHGAAINCNDK